MTYHSLTAADRIAMVGLRATLALGPERRFVPETRPGFEANLAKVPPAQDVQYEVGSVGGVAGWWCRGTEAQSNKAILYLHGGGYVIGSAAGFRHFAGQIAQRSGTSAFVPDYHLAPEHPFPAAIDDARAAYWGLCALGFERVAIVGDSAGGGLGLSLLSQLCRTNTTPDQHPACAAFMSPWTDLAVSGLSATERAHADPLVTRRAALEAAQLYLAGHDAHDPVASPVFGTLEGLPPVVFHVGEDEVFLDDSRRCADKIKSAGSTVELHVWEGMIHVFPSNMVILHAAREALEMIGAFLRRSL